METQLMKRYFILVLKLGGIVAGLGAIGGLIVGAIVAIFEPTSSSKDTWGMLILMPLGAVFYTWPFILGFPLLFMILAKWRQQ